MARPVTFCVHLRSAAGQSWLTCTVFPATRGSYTGRIENAFPGGRLPDIFGVCEDAEHPDISSNPQHCGAPHLVEQLAVGQVIDPQVTTGADLAPACELVAQRMMQTSDPTFGGELTLFTYPAVVEYDSDAIAGLSTVVSCLIKATDGRELAGSLINLGDRPLPFAS